MWSVSPATSKTASVLPRSGAKVQIRLLITKENNDVGLGSGGAHSQAQQQRGGRADAQVITFRLLRLGRALTRAYDAAWCAPPKRIVPSFAAFRYTVRCLTAAATTAAAGDAVTGYATGYAAAVSDPVFGEFRPGSKCFFFLIRGFPQCLLTVWAAAAGRFGSVCQVPAALGEFSNAVCGGSKPEHEFINFSLLRKNFKNFVLTLLTILISHKNNLIIIIYIITSLSLKNSRGDNTTRREEIGSKV